MTDLQEVKVLRTFLGSLFGKATSKAVQTGTTSASAEEKQAREIIDKIIAPFDIKKKKTERRKSAEAMVLRYHVSIGGANYVIKGMIQLETKLIAISLWDASQSKLLDVLSLGDLKSKYRLRAMGKLRLKPWTKGKK